MGIRAKFIGLLLIFKQKKQTSWKRFLIHFCSAYYKSSKHFFIYSLNSSNNTAVGHDSLRGSGIFANNTGGSNTAIGYDALQTLSSGYGNTAVGRGAGVILTTGSYNTLIGFSAGGVITTGAKNTFIGTYSGSANLNNTVVLSDGDGNIQLYATGSKVAIGKTATPNATLDVKGNTVISGSEGNGFTVYSVSNNTTPFRVTTGNEDDGVIINSLTTINNSATITGNITNILGMGFVSCSLAVSGSTPAQRAITAQFRSVNGTAVPRAQLIHWWTSNTQTGSVAIAAPTTTYLVVSGSNVVPLTSANSGSTIHHAVTDNSGKFAVRFTSAPGGAEDTFWFNTEVQGIIYSISSTLYDNT